MFNKLNYYHVCLPGLPPCLGRDVLEGVLSYDVKLFLDYLINEKWFSYKLLNRRIDIFEYSVEDQRDKLCSILPNSSKLSGGACQLWNFLRLLPLLIHDKIDDIEDDVWISILLDTRNLYYLSRFFDSGLYSFTEIFVFSASSTKTSLFITLSITNPAIWTVNEILDTSI